MDKGGTGSNELFIATLAFGLLALLGTAVVQSLKRQELTSYFVKLFGLLFISTLATAIIFADVGSSVRTGAYTILGTIAGYLAASRITYPESTADKDKDKHPGGEVPGPGGS